MSAETKAALDAAIAAHIADEEPGAIVTGYAGIIATTSLTLMDDEATEYFTFYADGQSFHVGLGLVHRHRMVIEHEDD